MRMDPAGMADFQGCGVAKTNAAALTNTERHHVYCQWQQADPHQFHEAIVADQMWELIPQIHTYMVFVIPFESSVIRAS